MTVAFDAASAVQSFGPVTTPAPWNHTATGTNRYVRVYVGWIGTGGSLTVSATYGGVAMSVLGQATLNSSGDNYATILELKNPATGAQAIQLTFSTGSIYGSAVSISYTGVNQTTPSGTPVTALPAAVTSSTCTVSSSSGNLVGDVIALATSSTAETPTQTSRMSNKPIGDYFHGASEAAGAGSVAMAWSWTSVTSGAQVAAEILQASAAATAITMSGPTAGTVGVASSNFTVGANGSITGTVVVTPSDGGGGGTFTPTTVSISSGSPTGTFTYTAASAGAKTISEANNGGLTNASNITYTASVRMVTVTLTSDGTTPRASLSGLKWAWFDHVTPDLFTATPTDKGATGTTDSSGIFIANLPNTAKTAGQIGFLVITDSDGTTTQSPVAKAFAGPAVVG